MAFVFSCKKEIKTDETITPAPKWERFVGDYNVYDTSSSYLYSMSISHFSGVNKFGAIVDTLFFQNFIDKFDLEVEFYENTLNKNTLNYGFYDSVPDKRGKHWFIGSEFDDLSTFKVENTLINDTIILYYKLTNIKYYFDEGEPYYFCECKQIAVKQN